MNISNNNDYKNNNIDEDLDQLLIRVLQENEPIENEEICEKIENLSNRILNIDFFKNNTESQVKITDTLKMAVSKLRETEKKTEAIVKDAFEEKVSDTPQRILYDPRILKIEASIRVNSLLPKLCLFPVPDLNLNETLNAFHLILQEIDHEKIYLTDTQIEDVNRNIENSILKLISQIPTKDNEIVESFIKKIQDTTLKGYRLPNHNKIDKFIWIRERLDAISSIIEIDENEKHFFCHDSDQINKAHCNWEGIAEFAKDYHLSAETQLLFKTAQNPLIDALVKLNDPFEESLFFIIGKSLPIESRSVETVKCFLHLTPDINDSIHQNYRVRQSEFKSSYHNADQNLYSELMHRGVMIGAKITEESLKNKAFDFPQFIGFFCKYRQEIAKKLNASTPLRVGHWRIGEDSEITPCVKIYKPLGENLNEILGKMSRTGPSGPGYAISYPKTFYRSLGYDKKDIEDMDPMGCWREEKLPKAMITIVGTIKDENDNDTQINLSKIIFKEEPPRQRPEESGTLLSVAWTIYSTVTGYFGFKESAPVNVVISHTSVEDGTQVMKYVAKLFNALMKESGEAPLDKKDLHEKLGEIFWWICQAKPWSLGDPSIAELLVRTIWLAKTHTLLPPWNENLIPWEKTVVIFDVNTFKKDFHDFFDKSFGYSSI